MKSSRLLLLAAGLFSYASGVAAAEFRSVGANPAIMRDAPSERGRKVFVAPRGMPVEIILTYGDWVKVRDVAGDLSWVESKALLPKRNVVVKAMNAKVRTSPDENAAPVFSADRGVILELVEPGPAGWAKVRHRDGVSGYVKVTEVWGD
jgi:SH3-like domain-containing protein